MRALPAIFLCAIGLCAQAPVHPEDPSVQFEVAAVKPFVIGMGEPVYLGGKSSPNRVAYTAATLKYLIATAYGVNEYQVVGPRWLDSQRYEVTALIPEGKSRAQANVMLQNLLAERFGLSMHRETRELEIYELQIAKGGPKLKESALVSPAPEPDQSTASRGFQPMKQDGDGFVVLPEGKPGMVVLMNASGKMQMSSSMQTMSKFAKFLEQTGRPVVDKTGLTGTYDINLEYSGGRLNISGLVAGGDAPLMIPGPGVAIEPGRDPSPAADPEVAMGLVSAVRQLGFKLESAKAPVPVFVVDQAKQGTEQN